MKCSVKQVKLKKEKSNFIYLLNNSGNTMAELVIFFILIGVILGPILKFVNTSNILSTKIDRELNSRMEIDDALEYMEMEIRNADKVVIYKVKPNFLRDSLGFVIINYLGNERYNFIRYEYGTKTKKIIRTAYKSSKLEIQDTKFTGNNLIISNIQSIEGTHFNDIDNHVDLNFKIKDGKNTKVLSKRIKLYLEKNRYE